MSSFDPARISVAVSTGISAGRAGRRLGLAVILLATTGAGIILLSTAKYGAGIESWDSVWYLDVARNLASGRGFVFHTGERLTLWPPFYPMLLALVGFVTGLDPAVFAHLVNAALFALVIYLSAHLFSGSFQQNTGYSLLCVCAVLFSAPLSDVYVLARSEGLFILLVVLYLVSAQRYWRSASVGALAVMTVSAGAAFLTRYPGMALVPAGVLTILLSAGPSLGVRANRALAFGVLSVVPVGLWLVCNPAVVGAWSRFRFGYMDPHGFAFLLASNVEASVRTILSWYNPGQVTWYDPGQGMWFTLLAAAAAAAIASSRALRSRFAGSVRSTVHDYLPCIALSVTYMLVLLLQLSAKHVRLIEVRYLSPVYIPITLILLDLPARLVGPTQPGTAPFLRRIPAVLVILWLCVPLSSVVRSTVLRFTDGAGFYSTRPWRESETIACAKRQLSASGSATPYSNGPDALWALAGVNATLTPERTAGSLTDLAGRWPAENGMLLVWLKNISWRPYLYTIEELGTIARVEEITRFSDGSVYRVWIWDKATADSTARRM